MEKPVAGHGMGNVTKCRVKQHLKFYHKEGKVTMLFFFQTYFQTGPCLPECLCFHGSMMDPSFLACIISKLCYNK